jgi:hypothetical protein
VSEGERAVPGRTRVVSSLGMAVRPQDSDAVTLQQEYVWHRGSSADCE